MFQVAETLMTKFFILVFFLHCTIISCLLVMNNQNSLIPAQVLKNKRQRRESLNVVNKHNLSDEMKTNTKSDEHTQNTKINISGGSIISTFHENTLPIPPPTVSIAPILPPVDENSRDIKESGLVANIYWRCVPMEDLRKHPLYHALPRPEEVNVTSILDVGLFRQDSWQWDALHQGRLTTSRLSSVLGMYEDKAATYLGIPRSLRGHARSINAWQLLKQKPIQDIRGLQSNKNSAERNHHQNIWPIFDRSKTKSKQHFPYFYKPYKPYHDSFIRGMHGVTSSSHARMAWGSAQESTALLAVLNYFHSIGNEASVFESGMLVFEALPILFPDLQDNLITNIQQKIHVEKSLPLLGASPDGVLRYKDGSCKVIEVKCYSPFIDAVGEDGRRLEVSRNRPANDGIPVWHIPQLQMEILCAGPLCSSAILVILYIDGAKIFELERDEQYQMEMISYVQEFYTTFIKSIPSNKMKPPHENFFNIKDTSYKAFLDKTRAIANNAKLIAELDEKQLQRSPYNRNFFVDDN